MPALVADFFISATIFFFLVSTFLVLGSIIAVYVGLKDNKPSSSSIISIPNPPGPVLARSLTWPIEATTSYFGPKNLPTVLAFAGDSTITRSLLIYHTF